MLSDINMSGMSGLELLPKAKAVRPDVPIIMITAYGDPETKRQAFENGAEALLTKPIDSRRCAVRSTAAPRAPHSRSKFPEFVALHESLDGTFRTCWGNLTMSALEGRTDSPFKRGHFRFLTVQRS
jgi:DNA-binding response OmpR family regulator